MSNENKKIKIKIHCNHQTKKKNRKISFKRKESKGFQSWDGPTAVESFIGKRLISADRSFLMMKASTGWMGYKRRQEGQWCTVCNIYQWGIDNSIHHTADWFAGGLHLSAFANSILAGWHHSGMHKPLKSCIVIRMIINHTHTHTHHRQTPVVSHQLVLVGKWDDIKRREKGERNNKDRNENKKGKVGWKAARGYVDRKQAVMRLNTSIR